VADDHAQARGRGGARFDHVGEQRPPGERVQDLGQVGVHALALAGGQDDDLQWGGGSHAETEKKGQGFPCPYVLRL
jgi:hypothetical protein